MLDLDKHLTINYAIKRSTNIVPIDAADIVISTHTKEGLGIATNVTLLHPGRDMEYINSLIF